MKKKIAVLPGDGIGPEVVEQAVKVLDAIAEKFDHEFDYVYGDMGAIAIDHTGDPYPKETEEICLASDAILFGAIGHPKYDNDPSAKVRPEQGLLRLRKSMGLFSNIRPVMTYPTLLDLSPLKKELVRDVNFVIYRELTGGIYFGEKFKSEDGNTASDLCIYHRWEIERIIRLAFEGAMKRRKKVTLVDKANVLESSRLWRETFKSIAKEYPKVEIDFYFVDNAAMQMVLNPRQFDVIVTSNMFGDILSDEASVITGSMGMLPSASMGEKTSLFEPIHGSYPEAAGKDIANPIATILSVAMMLDTFDMTKEAKLVRNIVTAVLQAGIGTAEMSPKTICGTAQLGNIIASAITDADSVRFKESKISDSISTII